MTQIKFLIILAILSLSTILNLEASENSLDDEYKIRILLNKVGYKLIIVDGEEFGMIGDSRNNLFGEEFDFSFMFPDNYIGSSNLYYTFDFNLGRFLLTRQDIFFTKFDEGSMYSKYNEDVGTSVSGEWYLFTPTLAYNFFRDSFLNIRTGFGLGFGRARYSGDIYLTENIHLENTLSSSCWDYTHSNETFEDISNFCSKKSIDSDYFNYGGHYFIDIRSKYVGFVADFYVLTNNRGGHLSKIANENLNKIVMGFYILIPL